MSKHEVILNDYYELLALHKALIEAKFHPNPENQLVAGSPLVANICNRVVEALIEIDAEKKLSNRDSWMKVLDIKKQKGFWERALNYASNDKCWNRMDVARKKHYVECLLSPFRFNKNDILLFISEVEKMK